MIKLIDKIDVIKYPNYQAVLSYLEEKHWL